MGERQYILAGRILDGTGAGVRRNVVLQVEDGIITGIFEKERLPQESSPTVDLADCTILPPLIDCSVFLARSPSIDAGESSAPQADPENQAVMLNRHVHDCHAHGVLGVADNEDIRALIVQDGGHGPKEKNMLTIRLPGRILPNGHPSGERFPGDFLKIAYSPSIEARNTTAPLLRPNVPRRIMEQRNGRKVVVIANGPDQVADALVAGCDAIEQGYDMGVANLRTMAENKTLWIPSVLRARNALDGSASGGNICCRFSLRYVAPGGSVPGAETFWKKTLARQLAQLSLAREMGVRVAVGTGAGSVGILHGEAMVEEMKLLTRGGFSLAEAVCCASNIGADFFGMNEFGPLAVGRGATFLVTRGTPAQLPRKLAYLEDIYINGAPSATYRKNPIRIT